MRLDFLVAERFPEYTMPQIQTWIMQGKVLIDGMPETKAGTQVALDAIITCNAHIPKYVGRAGFKLEKALTHFNIDVSGLTCLDAGIATGGFTDCLLQHGAQKVYGIDVGYGDVHEKVRRDPRVVLLERTNLRHISPEMIGDLVDVVTLDLSFISVLKVMEAVVACMKPHAQLIVLIKPQFEAKREDVGPGGVITDPAVHAYVVKEMVAGIEAYGFTNVGVVESPILGRSGNKEFLGYFQRNAP